MSRRSQGTGHARRRERPNLAHWTAEAIERAVEVRIDALIEKLFNDYEEYTTNQLRDLFWQEQTEFSTKVGEFSNSTRHYIWTSTAIKNGKSFEWHSIEVYKNFEKIRFPCNFKNIRHWKCRKKLV